MTSPVRASPFVFWPPRRRYLREAILVAASAVVLAMIGPFDAVPYGDARARGLYWLRMVVTGYAILRPGLALAGFVARRRAVPEGLAWAVASALAALPMAAVIWWIGPHPDLSRPPPSPRDFLQAYVQVAVIIAVWAPALWLARSRAPGPLSPPSASAPSRSMEAAPPALARRLPFGHGRIFALSMEDHYVRVHAEGGQTLLLMRMADAVTQMDGLDGAQVHRSWWVAREAVEGFERSGRRVLLKVRGGLLAPVSRERVRDLIADGWPLRR